MCYDGVLSVILELDQIHIYNLLGYVMGRLGPVTYVSVVLLPHKSIITTTSTSYHIINYGIL